MGRAKSSPAGYSGLEALAHVMRTQQRAARRPRVSTPGGVYGDWLIGVDEHGNLVAKHEPSGVVRVLAVVPAGSEDTNG